MGPERCTSRVVSKDSLLWREVSSAVRSTIVEGSKRVRSFALVWRVHYTHSGFPFVVE